MTEATTRIAPADLERTMERALEAAGTSAASAASVAHALTAAEIDGQKGHGLSRIPGYAAQVRAGKVDGAAIPTLHAMRPAALAVDAANGFAFPAFDLTVAELPRLAHTYGIAAAAVRRSHHAGALGLVVERLAEAGCVGLMLANTPAAMAAWGGRRALLGTNPLAFAAPLAGRAPLVVDLATTAVARSRIVAAARKGEPIPPGWAVDAGGQPTTDPRAALAGLLLPAGGPKGAAIALMVEVLAATLTGGRYACEASSFLDAEGGPPDVGQLIMALDADAFRPGEGFAERLAALAGAIEADGARLPGSRRLALREAAQRDGLAVDAKLLAEVEALAARAS